MKLKAAARLIVCLGVTFIVAAVGSIFTREAVSGWYANLNKPIFNPPSWLFGPVWTVLYLLMGVAVFLVWQKGYGNRQVRIAIWLYALQLVLNGLWSPIFFGLKMPFLAFCEILLLWVAIVLTIRAFARVSLASALLLAGYIAWVSFAAVLNFSIWMLNR
jgi:benzodiazapine receptor